MCAGVTVSGCVGSTEELEQQHDVQKERLERADFSAIEWKLNGVKVNPRIREVFDTLMMDEAMPAPQMLGKPQFVN